MLYKLVCWSYSLHDDYIGSGFELVDAVGVIVINHFSIDGQVRKEHFTKKHHNMFIVDKKQKLRESIIEHLSFPGSMVMEVIRPTSTLKNSGFLTRVGTIIN